jgi:GAF domain-containing protein
LHQNPFPLVISDVSTHPLTQHNQWLRGSVEAILFIPIVSRGEVIGIISADATEKGHIFTTEDIESGEAIADQLAIWLDNHLLLTEAQYRSERLQTAAEVSRAASSILDASQLIETSVNLIRNQFDFYYVGLFLVDEAREWAVLRAGTGEAGRIQLKNNHKLKIGGESMIGWCIQNRRARIALDVGQEAVRFQNPHLPDTHSEMALPLMSRDEVIGALTVQSTERGAFSPEDITMLQTMADQLANAIQNARLFENVIQAQQEAEVLLQETQALQLFSQMLAGTLQVNEILNIFFRACIDVLGFEYGMFSLVDKYQNRVKAVAGFGVSESQIKRANRSLDSHDIMADIIRTGQTEVITGWDERFDRDMFEAEGHADWVRIFTPVTLRQENIGLIETGFNKNMNKTTDEAQIRLLRAFIDQTALALDNAQRYEASQKAAHRETLIKEITTKVRASTNVDTILQTTVKELGDALGSKRAFVHLISPTNGEKK